MHRVLNFGSVLQAYSTCYIIKHFGFEPEIINYMEPRHTNLGAVKDILDNISFDDIQIWKIPMQIGIKMLKVVSYFIQRMKFNLFLSRNLPIGSKKYFSCDGLMKNPPEADIFMTGSDQVWNSEYNNGVDRAYFLDFVSVRRPRISYASSFGQDKILKSEADEVRSLLKKYQAISVRESSGVQIISEMGIEGAAHVLDPTLLLSRSEWEQQFLLEESPEDEPYLLIYSVERSIDTIIYTTAKKIADSLGLRIVFLSQAAKLNSMKGCDVQRSFTDVETFLRYFYNARFVVASSFHGLAFSINFERQFAVILPPRYNTRLRSLLNLFDLSGRIVEKNIDLGRLTDRIDYRRVSHLLQMEREKSFDFLTSNLSDI